MSTKTEQERQKEVAAVNAFLCGGIRQLMADGVDSESIATALSGVLGVMMGAAPLYRADALSKSVIAQMQRRRAEMLASIYPDMAH